jgi:HlyD family secretion protein
LLKAGHDLKAASELERKLQKSVPIYREQADAWEKLAKQGFAGRLLALDRQRTYLESEQDLRAQTENVAALGALIAQSNQRIAQITSNYRQQLQHERGEAEAAYQKLQQDWEKHQHRHSLLELRSPQAGIVKDIATHTPGAIVAPGTLLLTIVPLDEPLIAEVWIGNSDAGFVQASQGVRLKLVSYPFQKHGTLDGTVRHVSADAQEKPETAGPQARTPQDAAYRALVELGSQHLGSQGTQLKLVPGMQVSAEIHLGTRTVLGYLLSPIQKVAHEAGRER